MEEPVRISDYEKGVGFAVEMSPHEKARLGLAMRILTVLGGILVLSGMALIFGPSERLEQSQLIFEYVKTAVPPIVTLVIGFYFRSEGSS